MRLVVIGVNHKTAPVALRERLALVGDDVNVALNQIEAFTDGSVIVSTCNRTEIYALVPQTPTSQHANSQPSNLQSPTMQDVKAAGQTSNNAFSSSMNISSAAFSAHIIKIKAWLAKTMRYVLFLVPVSCIAQKIRGVSMVKQSPVSPS